MGNARKRTPRKRRAAAARKPRRRNPPITILGNPRISKREVNRLGGEYSAEMARWGPHNLATQRAFIRYMDAVAAWETQTGKVWGQNPAGARKPWGRQFGKQVDAVFYVHNTEGPRVHYFGPGVRVEALADGSIRLYHPKRRVWADLDD